jgi:hypothetical protein
VEKKMMKESRLDTVAEIEEMIEDEKKVIRLVRVVEKKRFRGVFLLIVRQHSSIIRQQLESRLVGFQIQRTRWHPSIFAYSTTKTTLQVVYIESVG